MDARISIDRPASVQSPSGADTPGWQEVCTVWAQAKPLYARERTAAAQVMPEESVTFTIRHRSDVGPEMTIRHAGKRWRITGIAPIGRREGLQITAEVTTAGA